MLFYSFFKTLVGKELTVELKNDLSITGTLHSVDQYLNIKLNNIKVSDGRKYPHMMAVRNCFIRGSVVRYIQVGCSSCLHTAAAFGACRLLPCSACTHPCHCVPTLSVTFAHAAPAWRRRRGFAA